MSKGQNTHRAEQAETSRAVEIHTKGKSSRSHQGQGIASRPGRQRVDPSGGIYVRSAKLAHFNLSARGVIVRHIYRCERSLAGLSRPLSPARTENLGVKNSKYWNFDIIIVLRVKFHCKQILNSLLLLRFLYIINIYNYLNEFALVELASEAVRVD